MQLSNRPSQIVFDDKSEKVDHMHGSTKQLLTDAIDARFVDTIHDAVVESCKHRQGIKIGKTGRDASVGKGEGETQWGRAHLVMVTKWGLCTLRHGIQNSMEAILACHPVLSTE